VSTPGVPTSPAGVVCALWPTTWPSDETRCVSGSFHRGQSERRGPPTRDKPGEKRCAPHAECHFSSPIKPPAMSCAVRPTRRWTGIRIASLHRRRNRPRTELGVPLRDPRRWGLAMPVRPHPRGRRSAGSVPRAHLGGIAINHQGLVNVNTEVGASEFLNFLEGEME
jgi:hypothetical protein